MKCLNFIVFYDNLHEVENYISQVAGISGGTVDIIVIVNSDKNQSISHLEQELNSKGVNCFKIIEYGDNIGYLNSMLKTIKNISVDHYDYFILSNTDIYYDDISFFQKLAEKKYSRDIGCIAPSVYSSNSNSYSNPHYLKRLTKAKLVRNKILFRFPVIAKLFLKLAKCKATKNMKNKKSSCYVYSPHGCYMIFTRGFIKSIIGYEYGAKLYSEESAIGELLIKNKMKCFYDNSLSLVHMESSVTGVIDYKKKFRLWSESLKYILNEFYH